MKNHSRRITFNLQLVDAFITLLFLVLTVLNDSSLAFTVNHSTTTRVKLIHPYQSSTSLFAQKQSRSTLLDITKIKPTTTSSDTPTNTQKASTQDKSSSSSTENEEIYGAKFFGGNAVKEELFDAELEENADRLLKLYPRKSINKKDVQSEEDLLLYYRFQDVNSFPDEEARIVAQQLQQQIRFALYDMDEKDAFQPMYSPTVQWKTPFTKASTSNNPLQELTNALNFYKRVDVAIVSAKTLSSSSSSSSKQMEIRWDISLVWPNLYESRVLLTGHSILTVDGSSKMIIAQSDHLDAGGKGGQDILSAIKPQLDMRFWDMYHIGMTPSAELLPRCVPSSSNSGQKSLFHSYKIFEIPPRLVCQPSILDLGGREMREAQAIPNHAFTSIIKTTGPSAQRYVTVSPVEVSIGKRPSSDDTKKQQSVITWSIPCPPEFVSYLDTLPLPDIENDENFQEMEPQNPTFNYVYRPKRLVATMAFGGNAQDEQVTNVRKMLYEQVVKDGFKPVVDENQRPVFFFLQNDSKACFTADGGLGMAVYEWRLKSSDSNEVGIELQF